MAERPSRAFRLCCLSICALALAANVRGLLAPAPPSWDDGWYLENSFRLFFALKTGLAAAFDAFAHAFRIKAPLICVLPLPLYSLFGPLERVAPWANQPLLALTWYAVYRIGRALLSERAGWASAAACASIPLLNALSRLFLVETLLTALVACSIWAIVEARPTDGRWELRGVLLGLGLLAKVSFPLYIAGPVWLARRRLRDDAGRSLALGAAVASSWYAFNLVYVVGFAASVSVGPLARHYGSISLAATATFLRELVFGALSWPLAAAAAASLVAAWATSRSRWSSSATFLAAWLGVPLLVVSASVNKELRFSAPALPALALAAGAAAARLSPRALALLAALLFVEVGAMSSPPRHGDQPWDRAALLDAVERHATSGSVVAVALEHARLNANNLASLSASRGAETRFISLGYAQPSAEGALIRLKDKSADMLVFVDGAPAAEAPADLNRANAGLRRMVESGRLNARPLETVALSPGVTARLYSIEP